MANSFRYQTQKHQTNHQKVNWYNLLMTDEQLYEKVLGLVKDGKSVLDILAECHMYFSIAQDFEEQFIDRAIAEVKEQ